MSRLTTSSAFDKRVCYEHCPALLKAYPALNDAQRDIVGHDQGPLLVIAGPGSGNTFSLVLRALNLLLHGKAVLSSPNLQSLTGDLQEAGL